MVRQCCQCRKVQKNNRWVTPEQALPVGETVSHGYCPPCAMQFQREIKTCCFNSNHAFTPAAKDSGLQGIDQQQRNTDFEES